ncbi:MAG: hypothetical protein ABI873_10040 [Marmoricola sp.]
MLLTHALVLSQARAHIAALADQARSEEASSAYERVLISLDRIHGDQSPDFEPIGIWLDPTFLVIVANTALEELETFGVEPLEIELLLAGLDDARAIEGS